MNQASLNTDAVEDASDKLASDVQALSTHAQELLAATRSLSGEGVAVAREKLNESVTIARERLAQLRQTADQRTREAVARLDTQVTEHPRESVAAVALAALVLGWISGSSSSGSFHTLARLGAIGVLGTAGSVLLSAYRQTRALPAQAPAEEVGRWESEGGAAPSASDVMTAV